MLATSAISARSGMSSLCEDLALSVVCGEVSRERVAVESECNVDVPDCRDVSCAVV